MSDRSQMSTAHPLRFYLNLRLGPTSTSVQPIELCFHDTWRPSARRIKIDFMKAPCRFDLDDEDQPRDDSTEPETDADEASAEDMMTSICHSWPSPYGDNSLCNPVDLRPQAARRTPPWHHAIWLLGLAIAFSGLYYWQYIATASRSTSSHQLELVEAVETMCNNYLAAVPDILTPMEPLEQGQREWLPRRVVSQLHRETGLACNAIKVHQTTRGWRNAPDVSQSCEHALANLSSAVQVLDDLTADLVADSPSIFSFHAILHAFQSHLGRTPPPSSNGPRNQTADWFAESWTRALDSWADTHDRLAVPIQTCLDHLLAAKKLEQESILPWLGELEALARKQRKPSSASCNAKTSHDFLTSYLLPRRDIILDVLDDSTEHFALARATHKAVEANIRRLSAYNWHTRDLAFTEIGSFVGCKGERYIELSAAGEAEVLWLFGGAESTRVELGRIKENVTEVIENAKDRLRQFVYVDQYDEIVREPRC
ncbi:hypothetical protein K4K49_002999 [Colletotrichum sp. SAR 10_70]|nr:hypothetical protein K4K50_001913 [Colletotrichum sp. SAR 10_71]KAI8173997.1 hypothetical protein K4K49_002999 [Colletotrichum sp. SAR 10_70]KAI8206938.1 hypothetical protein K4K52_002769 [Colletotrichum sp. SAR 10_76]KAI8242984.1 hypothetical protein K4K53_003498 [Colletotrichum sp. SAR 10_77]